MSLLAGGGLPGLSRPRRVQHPGPGLFLLEPADPRPPRGGAAGGKIQRPGLPLRPAGRLVSTLVWNYGLGKPFGFEGAIVGTLCNFVVFALCTRAYRRYRSQTLRVWKTR